MKKIKINKIIIKKVKVKFKAKIIVKLIYQMQIRVNIHRNQNYLIFKNIGRCLN